MWYFTLLFLCLSFHLQRTEGIWKLFDFVRTRKDAWGSPSNVPFRKINANAGNGPRITAGSRFGISIANLGDLDGDGVDDLAVGACGEDNTYVGNEVAGKSGAVYILFMTFNGTVKSSSRIGGLSNGGPMLYKEDEFGYSVSALGDLDGDDVLDMVVGAPGQHISSVFVLYLNKNGTAKDYVLIRGQYAGTLLIQRTINGSYPEGAYIPNGPVLSYSARFGSAMTSIGDWDKDGIPDFAVSSNHVSGGQCSVYLLFMFRNGTVKDYIELAPGLNGGPEIVSSFSSFGTTLMLMPDHNGDGIPELIIGAKELQDEGTSHYHSGVIFFCFMEANGKIKSYSRISELSDASGSGALPLTAEDNCGNGIAQIGDINKDNMRQHWPLLLSPDAAKRPPVNDLIIGCPQTNTEVETGRVFILFLTDKARMKGYTLLPSATDFGIAPVFRPRAHVGASMAAIQDLDNNGLKEIAVGAPGDDENGKDAGALYVFYFRRRRWHPFVPDTRSWLCSIIIPPSIAVFAAIVSIIYCCWRFRRKPDEIELMVKAAGVDIGADPQKKKKRKKGKKTKEGGEMKNDDKVYADDF